MDNVDNIWGWLILLFSFVVFVLLLNKQERDKSIVTYGLLVIFMHHLLSLVSIMFGPLKYASYDAWTFHAYAYYRVDHLHMLNWTVGAEFYKSMLTVVYKYFGASQWLGQSISILFFSLSCVVFVRIAKKLEIDNLYIAIALLIFGLLPSSLMFGCFTLRETYMTFFFMLGVFYGWQAIDKLSRSNLLLAMLFLFVVGLFHHIMLLYVIGLALVLLICFFVRSTEARTVNLNIFIGVILLVLISIALGVKFLPVGIADNYFAMLDIRLHGVQLSIPEAVNLYRESVNEAEATTKYTADLTFSTWFGMFQAFLVSYVFYLGWPFFGDYSSLSTWVILSEALLRLLGLLSLFFIWRDKRVWWFAFVYFSATFIWNIGSTNHGQALRHHIMTEWILLLFLLIAIQQYINKKRVTSD